MFEEYGQEMVEEFDQEMVEAYGEMFEGFGELGQFEEYDDQEIFEEYMTRLNVD